MTVSRPARFLFAVLALLLLTAHDASARKGGRGGSRGGGSSSSSSTESTPGDSDESDESSSGPEEKDDQSTFTVFGMEICGPVYYSGSDDRSAAFNAEILPGALELVETNLQEGVEYVAAGVTRLDEDMLFLLNDSDRPVRVYFVNEGAGYRNTLGYATSMAGSDEQGEGCIIFPDVSDGSFGGTAWLQAGDFVELGDFPQGTSFEFFIVRDAVNGGRDIFTYRDELNPDGLQHLAAWLLGDRYVLLGFEDLMNGGDLDYNDVVFVVDLSPDLGQGPINLLPR